MRLLVFAAMVFAATAALAQDADISDETNLPIQTSENLAIDSGRINVFSAWDFLKMVLILAAVVAAIYGLFYLLKRTGNPKLVENRLIRVLSSKAINSNRTLHLVEVGNQVFLVGSSESNVSLVAEIVDKETLDGLKLQSTAVAEGERKSFTQILSQVFGKSHSASAGALPEPSAIDFLKTQREKLRQM